MGRERWKGGQCREHSELGRYPAGIRTCHQQYDPFSLCSRQYKCIAESLEGTKPSAILRTVTESMLSHSCGELTWSDWLASLVHNTGGRSNGSAKSFGVQDALGSTLPSKISHYSTN